MLMSDWSSDVCSSDLRYDVRTLPGKAACRCVWPVLQPGHRLQHALTGFLAHVRLVVEHARDGLHRHAGGGRDILDSGAHDAGLLHGMRWACALVAARWRCNMMHGSTSSLYDHHRAPGMLRRSARPAVTTCGRHGHEAHARSEEHTSELQ